MTRADRVIYDIAILLRSERAIVVVQDDDGQWTVGRANVGLEDTARVLYASADAVVNRLPHPSKLSN